MRLHMTWAVMGTVRTQVGLHEVQHGTTQASTWANSMYMDWYRGTHKAAWVDQGWVRMGVRIRIKWVSHEARYTGVGQLGGFVAQYKVNVRSCSATITLGRLGRCTR